jgi:hypothetical protein
MLENTWAEIALVLLIVTPDSVSAPDPEPPPPNTVKIALPPPDASADAVLEAAFSCSLTSGDVDVILTVSGDTLMASICTVLGEDCANAAGAAVISATLATLLRSVFEVESFIFIHLC